MIFSKEQKRILGLSQRLADKPPHEWIGIDLGEKARQEAMLGNPLVRQLQKNQLTLAKDTMYHPMLYLRM